MNLDENTSKRDKRLSSAIEGMTASEAFKAMHSDPELLRKIEKEKKRKENAFNSKKEGFSAIRKLLNEKGPLNVETIHLETGIPKELINEYIREERLEIPSFEPAVFICEKCGSRIRTGFLCDKCKAKGF